MHKNVEIVIGRLATDPRLQERFALDPREVLLEQGLELTDVETAALAAIAPGAFRALTAALDARLRKASREGDGGLTLDETTTESNDSSKETMR